MSKGVKYGENGISCTHSRHSGKTWFLCASKRNIQLINNYRKSIIVK